MKRGVKKRLENIIGPTIVEFDLHDVIQIIIGASILAVPIGFTQETWKFGEILPLLNILVMMGLTLVFLAIFTYFHYHKEHMTANPKYHLFGLGKRVLVTYAFSFIIVSLLLSLIQVISWSGDALLAFKRVVVITFPSAMGAAVSDTIK